MLWQECWRLFLCRKYWGEILACIELHIIFQSIHVFQYTSVCTSKELWRKAFRREMMIYQNRRFVGINQVQLSIYSEGLQVQKEILSMGREYSWKHTTYTADSTMLRVSTSLLGMCFLNLNLFHGNIWPLCACRYAGSLGHRQEIKIFNILRNFKGLYMTSKWQRLKRK